LKPEDKRLFELIGKVFSILLILFVFLFSIDLLVSSLGHLGRESVRPLLSVTANPFISLFIGLLATAILQSSSTTTSMIVAMVASGSMDLSSAVPMVMGANIGTTITSDLVSLSFIAKKLEFRRAISVSTSHDFFNIILTTLLFPLEYFFGFLSEMAFALTENLTFTKVNDGGSEVLFGVFKNMYLSESLYQLIDNKVVALILSVILLFASIKMISKITYTLLIGQSRSRFERFIFRDAYKSFFWGILVTSVVQSSSVTTSLVVPVSSTGRIKIKDAFPFIMGANIGTTLTAMLAALFKTDAAISLALTHLLFNLIGVILFLPIPSIRNIPVYCGQQLGILTLKFRIIGFIYILVTFFLLPFTLIFLSK